MHVIHIDRLTVSHAARLIFKDLSWSIGDHDRIGLVGPNGVGKGLSGGSRRLRGCGQA